MPLALYIWMTGAGSLMLSEREGCYLTVTAAAGFFHSPPPDVRLPPPVYLDSWNS